MKYASVVNIKRLAVHDGPGIRTTVFLKGCSLSCKWCHNPESISPRPQLGLLERKCVLCGACAKPCPGGCHSFSGGRHAISRRECVLCFECVRACLHDALVIYGRRLSSEEVCNTLLEDRLFYDYSGGGVTLSGGEPLLQADFCGELFSRLQAEGIHCAVDTSGHVPWRSFKKVLPSTDLFLYDIKHIDPREHEIFTGASNKLILENLRKLSEAGKPIAITMPVIPRVNSSEIHIRDAGEFLSGLKNIIGLKLLPYHELARSKYAAVGLEDTMPPAFNLPENLVLRAAEILREAGMGSVTLND